MLELARELGMALADSPEFGKLVAARRNMNEDPALLALWEEYNEKKNSVLRKIGNGEDDLVELSEDLDRLQGQLLENPVFTDLMDAESEFQKLVASVNEEISKCITDAAPELKMKTTGCSGHCASCRGCKN